MGIPRLLKILGDVTTRQNLSAYRGKRAGIDGYTWLHRSLYCIGDGILKDPIDISRCINFFIKKLQLTSEESNNSYNYFRWRQITNEILRRR